MAQILNKSKCQSSNVKSMLKAQMIKAVIMKEEAVIRRISNIEQGILNAEVERKKKRNLRIEGFMD